MLDSVKIQRRQSEIRQALAELVGKDTPTDDETRQMACHQDGREVNLTAVEFRMLRCFLLRPGEVLSKSYLSGHIYDGTHDADSNVIEVFVNRLRTKLGRDLIATRRGQGYVLVQPTSQ